MGLLTCQLMAETLINQRNDLEANIENIYSAKIRLASTINELVNTGMDLDPDSAEYKLLEQRQKKLELIDKQLDQSLKRYQTLLTAVEQRIETEDKNLQKNISYSFGKGGQ